MKLTVVAEQIDKPRVRITYTHQEDLCGFVRPSSSSVRIHNDYPADSLDIVLP